MNINSIQTGQVLQNAARSADKGGSSRIEVRGESSSVSVSSDAPKAHPSEPAIIAGIGFLKQELDELLTSYPPFFPAGSYQRPDLIKRIRTLEEQIGRSETDENVKEMFSGEKLADEATDEQIAVSLDRLFDARDRLSQKQSSRPEQIKPGSFLNVRA